MWVYGTFKYLVIVEFHCMDSVLIFSLKYYKDRDNNLQRKNTLSSDLQIKDITFDTVAYICVCVCSNQSRDANSANYLICYEERWWINKQMNGIVFFEPSVRFTMIKTTRFSYDSRQIIVHQSFHCECFQSTKSRLISFKYRISDNVFRHRI